jgi:hypothetical protein
MKNQPLPDQDQISRYCRGGSVSSDGKVTGASFLPKPDEDYISVNWLELLDLPDRSAEISEVRGVLTTKLRLGATALVSVLNVGEVKSHVYERSEDGRMLRILHRPDEPPEYPDPSHSGIFEALSDRETICILIAEVVRETYPAKKN